MLPIVLVLLVASSAIAAPSVSVNLTPINEIAPQQGNGNLISSALINNVFELFDGGDANIYILTTEENLKDLANRNDAASQAFAIGQTLAVATQLAYGIPGDACDAAKLIDKYVIAARSGNPKAARGAINAFVQRLAAGIDLIAQVATNPEKLRYASGSRGNCNNGGRSYQFEGAWDFILSSVPQGSAGLINEQYCAAKRLYTAFNARSNNVAAFFTAASLPPLNNIFREVATPLAKFFTAAVSGNVGSTAGTAKQALLKACRN